MSWCDKLASTPAIGLMLDRRFVPIELIPNSFAPILNQHLKDDRFRFSIGKYNQTNVDFSTEDGFRYGAEPSHLFVAFNHRLKMKRVSAGLPIMEMTSTPGPYTELLPIVGRKLIEATKMYPDAGSRRIERVSIRADTTVSL